MCPLPVKNKKKSEIWGVLGGGGGGGGGGGHLSPVSRLWGWSVCPPSSIPSLLPL